MKVLHTPLPSYGVGNLRPSNGGYSLASSGKAEEGFDGTMPARMGVPPGTLARVLD